MYMHMLRNKEEARIDSKDGIGYVTWIELEYIPAAEYKIDYAYSYLNKTRWYFGTITDFTLLSGISSDKTSVAWLQLCMCVQCYDVTSSVTIKRWHDYISNRLPWWCETSILLQANDDAQHGHLSGSSNKKTTVKSLFFLWSITYMAYTTECRAMSHLLSRFCVLSLVVLFYPAYAYPL